MEHFKKKEAEAIRLHYDGLPPSEIALRCLMADDDVRRAVRRFWAYEKRLYGKPAFEEIMEEVFGC